MTITVKIPTHLASALRKGLTTKEARGFVRELEQLGCRVVVTRTRLGDPKAQGFGETVEVYRTTQKTKPTESEQ